MLAGWLLYIEERKRRETLCINDIYGEKALTGYYIVPCVSDRIAALEEVVSFFSLSPSLVVGLFRRTLGTEPYTDNRLKWFHYMEMLV